MEKVALTAPAGIVTAAGTLAAGLLLVRTIAAPPDGAIPLSVSVACSDVPPVIELTDVVIAARLAAGGTTFTVAVLLAAP